MIQSGDPPPGSLGDAFEATYAAGRAGEAHAFDALVLRFEGQLRSFIGRQMSDSVRRRQDSEDIYQISIATFLRRLPTFPVDLGERECRSYLFQIARWTLGDVARKRTWEVGESAVAAFEARQDPPSTGFVTREDELSWLREHIVALRDTYALVLKCCVIEGKTIDETASELGLERETVKKRLVRAREELRKRLKSSTREE